MGSAKWRVGRKVGRTIYLQIGDSPDDTDQLIGVMDTRGLAALAVAAPDLLAAAFAVSECRVCPEDYGVCSDCLSRLRAAISRTEGGGG